MLSLCTPCPSLHGRAASASLPQVFCRGNTHYLLGVWDAGAVGEHDQISSDGESGCGEALPW